MSRKAETARFASGETEEFDFLAEGSISEGYTQMLQKVGRWAFGWGIVSVAERSLWKL